MHDDRPKFSDVNAASNQFRNDTKDFTAQRDAIAKVRYIASRPPSPGGDQAMIFSYMKLLDPSSTVREGEQATAKNARGIPDKLRTMYNRLITGESLTPAQRKDFAGVADGVYKTTVLPQVKKIAHRHAVKLGKYGMSIDDIYDADEWENPAAAGARALH
jgi:hypothetical protein